MAALKLGQGVTHYFLRQAGTFSTFTCNTQRLANFAITAAALQNCFPDLTVSNTLAETNIHKLWTIAGLWLGDPELNGNENACQNCFGFDSGGAMSGKTSKEIPCFPHDGHEKTGTGPVCS